MWLTATPWPEVNAVERVHFVEYGVIAYLFYRAWNQAGDLSIVLLPLLASLMVGTLDEGVWHVRRCNVAEPAEAWRENLILERYFAPVLDTPTYASRQANRWPPGQRADLERRGGAVTMDFTSAAEPYPIVAWPKGPFWMMALLLAALLAAVPAIRSSR